MKISSYFDSINYLFNYYFLNIYIANIKEIVYKINKRSVVVKSNR